MVKAKKKSAYKLHPRYSSFPCGVPYSVYLRDEVRCTRRFKARGRTRRNGQDIVIVIIISPGHIIQRAVENTCTSALRRFDSNTLTWVVRNKIIVISKHTLNNNTSTFHIFRYHYSYITISSSILWYITISLYNIVKGQNNGIIL